MGSEGVVGGGVGMVWAVPTGSTGAAHAPAAGVRWLHPVPAPRPLVHDLRPARPDDFGAVHALNAAAVPAVSDVPVEELRRLAAQGSCTVADVEGGVAAFLLTLGPGADYDSVNYRFFADRHEAFLYVDRIVVSAHARGLGLGRALYDLAMASSAAPVLCAEVNVRPRNDASLAFHERCGFTPVGEQETPPFDADGRGAKRVVLLERSLG